jgi:hypothetical protein
LHSQQGSAAIFIQFQKISAAGDNFIPRLRAQIPDEFHYSPRNDEFARIHDDAIPALLCGKNRKKARKLRGRVANGQI